jgi:hypothetical protein
MKLEKDMRKGVHFRDSYNFLFATPVTSTFDLNIYQDVELVIGNLHMKFEKDMPKGMHFKGKVKVL